MVLKGRFLIMVKGVYVSVVDRATNKNIDYFRVNVDNAKKAKKIANSRYENKYVNVYILEDTVCGYYIAFEKSFTNCKTNWRTCNYNVNYIDENLPIFPEE